MWFNDIDIRTAHGAAIEGKAGCGQSRTEILQARHREARQRLQDGLAARRTEERALVLRRRTAKVIRALTAGADLFRRGQRA